MRALGFSPVLAHDFPSLVNLNSAVEPAPTVILIIQSPPYCGHFVKVLISRYTFSMELILHYTGTSGCGQSRVHVLEYKSLWSPMANPRENPKWLHSWENTVA